MSRVDNSQNPFNQPQIETTGTKLKKWSKAPFKAVGRLVMGMPPFKGMLKKIDALNILEMSYQLEGRTITPIEGKKSPLRGLNPFRSNIKRSHQRMKALSDTAHQRTNIAELKASLLNDMKQIHQATYQEHVPIEDQKRVEFHILKSKIEQIPENTNEQDRDAITQEALDDFINTYQEGDSLAVFVEFYHQCDESQKSALVKAFRRHSDNDVLARDLILQDGQLRPNIHKFISDFVKIEIRNTTDVGTLLRGNTFTTKLITIYQKEQTKTLMQKTVKGFLLQLKATVENDCLHEVDLLQILGSAKVIEIRERIRSENKGASEQYIHTALVKELDNEQQEQLKAAQQALNQQAENFLSMVLDVIKKPGVIPNELKQIYRVIFEETVEKFGKEEAKKQVVASFALRLLNPALVVPEGFATEVHLTKDERREAKLVSKIFQNIANSIVPGDKEAYMSFCADQVTSSQKTVGDIATALHLVNTH